MSSDDDLEQLAKFVKEEKKKVKKRYMTSRELKDLDTMDDFIVDSETEDDNPSDDESEEESGEECDLDGSDDKEDVEESKPIDETKHAKTRIMTDSPLFSELSDSASEEKEDIKPNRRKRLQRDDGSNYNDDKTMTKKKITFNNFALKSRPYFKENISTIFNHSNLSKISLVSDTGDNLITPKKRIESVTKTCVKENRKPQLTQFVTPISKLPKKPFKTVLSKPDRGPVFSDSDSGSEYDCSFIDNCESPIQSNDDDSSSDPLTDSDSSTDLIRPSFHTPAQMSKKKPNQVPQTVPSKLQSKKLDFISSLLDNVEDKDRDCDAIRFRKSYKTLKEELALKIYGIYNEKVFLNKLPQNIEIKWYPRLRKTAGRCVMSYNKESHSDHLIKIQLSTKVLTDTDRLLKTLVHEMCHGAVWMINKKDDHHGPVWKAWTYEAKQKFPALPVSTRCHSYEIEYKYEYWCLHCNVSVKRHSKSLDITRKICGRCKGRFTLFMSQPNGEKKLVNEESKEKLSGFSQFVKDNYKRYRSTGISHGEVMQILSAKYRGCEVKDNLSNMMAMMNIVDGSSGKTAP